MDTSPVREAAESALQSGSCFVVAPGHSVGVTNTGEITLRKNGMGLQSTRLCGGLNGMLRSTHIAQHHSQRRIAERLGRRDGHRPLHLHQGMVILLLVEIDIAQNYVASVRVIEDK